MYFLYRAEFILNNHVSRTTRISPFFANRGYKPRIGTEPCPLNTEGDPFLEKVDRIFARRKPLDKKLHDAIKWSQDEQARHANKRRQAHPNYKVGDLVYINTRDFATSRPNKGLDWKFYGP